MCMLALLASVSILVILATILAPSVGQATSLMVGLLGGGAVFLLDGLAPGHPHG
jgi:hypothetical protein